LLLDFDLIAAMAGAAFQNLERTTQIPPQPDAVLVRSVVRGSAASLRGLRAGDIILAANQKPVHSEENLLKIAESAERLLTLDIRRGDDRVVVVIQ
jgi:serine protease Do